MPSLNISSKAFSGLKLFYVLVSTTCLSYSFAYAQTASDAVELTPQPRTDIINDRPSWWNEPTPMELRLMRNPERGYRDVNGRTIGSDSDRQGLFIPLTRQNEANSVANDRTFDAQPAYDPQQSVEDPNRFRSAGFTDAQTREASLLGGTANPALRQPGDQNQLGRDSESISVISAPDGRQLFTRNQARIERLQRSAGRIQTPASRLQERRGRVISRSVQGNINDLTTGALGDDGDAIELISQEPLDRRDALERDPWAALGIRMGPFLAFPSLTLQAGYSSNATRSSGGVESATLDINPELIAVSQWDRHELRAELRGALTYYEGRSKFQPDSDSLIALRLDLPQEMSANLRGSYFLARETASSDAVTAAVLEPGDAHTLTFEGDVTRRFGPVNATLVGRVQRSLFTDARLNDGSISSNEDRQNTEINARLRLSSAGDAFFLPFVEGSAGQRHFDERLDRNGFDRNARLYALRGGISFDNEATLSGTLGLGYSVDDPEDSRLDNVQGITLDGQIVWAFSPLTTLTLNAQSDLRPTTLNNSGGSLGRSLGFVVAHDLRRNVRARLEGRFTDTRYEGISRDDQNYLATLGVDWRLNRVMDLTAEAQYERLISSDDGRDFSAASILAGVRLKR